jgi:hypothetical protein
MRESMCCRVGKLLTSTATVLALGASLTVVPQFVYPTDFAAWAESQGGQGSGQGSQGSGGQGSGGQGSGTQGQGGPGEDSMGQGPKAGSGGTSGGKPVWAQEGIPEVELGRLNVARSPDSVLQRAFNEALASLTPDMVAFYNLSTSEMIELLTFHFDDATYIASPLQNLALLKEALDGTSVLNTLGVTTDPDTLMAIFLAVASDKEGDGPTALLVEAVTTILGTPITGDAAAALAAEAQAIWVAVVAGHG